MKKLLFIPLFLLATLELTAGEYVVFRVAEAFSTMGGMVPAIHITRTEGGEKIELEIPKDKNIPKNDAKILQELQKLDEQGFKLVSSYGGDNFKTLIFYKE